MQWPYVELTEKVLINCLKPEVDEPVYIWTCVLTSKEHAASLTQLTQQ